MKRRIVIVTFVFLLFCVFASLANAQGELTLEGLAARLESMVGRVDANEERIQALETRLAPTPTATVTPTATPESRARLTTGRKMNVRWGPGTQYAIIGTAEANATFEIIGQNLSKSWWQIDYEGQPGWVYAPYVTAIYAGDVEIVPTPTRVPTATPVPTSTPRPTATAQTEVQQEVRLATLLAIQDYEGIWGLGSFFDLSEDERDRRIAFYISLFMTATQKCGLEYSEMFRIVKWSGNQLELAGVSAKIETPMRAYWLEWFSTNEITDPCEYTIQDETLRLLDQHSTTSAPRPTSTPPPADTAVDLEYAATALLWADFLTDQDDWLALPAKS